MNELRRQEIKICCLQEVEINKDFPVTALSSRDYKIETETNATKSRSAIYIHSSIPYVRGSNIEEPDLGIVILDLDLSIKIRLINLYRVFNPVNGMSQSEFFENQLRIIKKAHDSKNNYNIVLMGDFNLDHAKKYSLEYSRSNLYTLLNNSFDLLNFTQLIKFPTWERMIRGIIKKSILDHVYVNDFSIIDNIIATRPLFGDHLLISFEIGAGIQGGKPVERRTWQFYSKEWLLSELAQVDFGGPYVDSQTCWNVLENALINIVDKICPLVPFMNNTTVASCIPNPQMKNKLNLRKRLLRQFRNSKDQLTKNRISQLNVEIKNHFHSQMRNSVRRGLVPGNNKTLWDAVKRAKNLNCNQSPDKMKLNDNEIPPNEKQTQSP